MNEDAIKDAYDLFVNTGYNKSYDNFKALIQSNPAARKDAYDLFVSTGYNKTQKDFDELMGVGAPAPVKKKEQVSPSQQNAQPTSLATGGEMAGGPSAPSAKKGPSLQEQLQASVNLAAGAAVASSKPGFTPVPKEQADKALFGKANVQTGTLKGIPGQTKSTVQNLNEKYKDLGVSFKEAPSKIQKGLGLGDIVVTADDGSTHIVQSTGSDEKLREEEAKLQTFLMGKSAGVEKKPVSPMEFLMMSRDGISPQEEAKFKRVYSQELVDSSIKFANNELEKTKDGVDKIQAEIAKLNEDAMIGGVTPEIEARFSELQGEYERSIKYAKSIASLTDEGVKKAAGENARIMGEQGNLPSAMYNSLLKFVENSVTGVLDIANQAASVAYTGLAELASINMGVDVTAEDLGDAKAAREAYTKAIDDVMSSVEADVSEEYVQSLPPVLKALVGAAEFVPNMLIPAANIRYGVLVSQGVGRRLTELNDSPMTKDLPENEKFFMSAVPAMVEAALENFGISQWAGANKGLISSVTVDVLSKVVPQAGMRGVKKLINAEINNLVLRGAVNTAGAMISEAETGALQSISDTAFREAYEIAKGKDLFNQPGFNEEGFKEALLEDAKMEALGGMWMAGAANIAQQTAEYVTGKSNTNETFALMKQILASNTTESALASTLKSQILSGKISKEQAQNTFRNFREAKAIVRELPQELSEDNQRAAFDLIAEKRKLTKQIEGKDPALVDKQKKRITEIDNQLITISNAVQEQTTSEVPVQPETGVGEEVVEGKPQPEPQVAAEEGQDQEEVIPGEKAVVSGIEITYPTEQEKTERQKVRNSKEYVSAKAFELPVITEEEFQGDIEGEFAMVTAENPKAQPLTEEENVALNTKAEQWLIDKGYSPKKIVGKYDQAENSFFVKGMTKEDAFEFAKEFNQESVAHSDGMIYQNGKMNPRNKAKDNFETKNFVPGDNVVSIINTPEGPKTFSVGYDFEIDTDFAPKTNIDEAVNKSAESLNMVAPDLKIIVAENTDDAQMQIAEALSAVAPSQAGEVAGGFTTETRGQTVFVNGKPFAMVFNKESADSTTVGHEAWEVLLNDAFADDQARMKEFVDSIDAQLRAQGFEEIADKLDAFASQRGYEAVKYSEYMAELGGMLVASGFGKGPLTAQQKTILQKIGDIINKFAQLFTGKKQFLDQATPEDILGFMITISEKVSKGEDISQFFRGETPGATMDGGIVSRAQIGKDSVDNQFDMSIEYNDSNMSDKLKMPEVEPIENVLKESGGAAVFINSDGTKVGMTRDNKKLQGGWRYAYFEENINDNIGFAATSEAHVGTFHRLIQQIASERDASNPEMAGKPVAVFVTIQNAESMLGEWYAGEFLMDGLDKAITEKKTTVAKARKLMDTAIAEAQKRYIDSERKASESKGDARSIKEIKGDAQYKQLDKLKGIIKEKGFDTHEGRIKAARELGSKAFSFKFRSSLLSELIPLKSATGKNPEIKKLLLDVGYGRKDFYKDTMDEILYDALEKSNFKESSIGGTTLGGFYADPYVTREDFLANKNKGIQHEMFNESFSSNGKSFRLDKARNVNKLFPSMGFPDARGYKLYNDANNASESKSSGIIGKNKVTKWLIDNGHEKTVTNPFTAISGTMYTSTIDADYQKPEEETKVTAKSQKSVPAVVDEVLTDDGKGNYVFVHYSDEKRDTIKPMSGSKKNFTGREEVAAISSVGGVAMYYTKQGQVESGVGDVPHTVLVPKDKVYFYGTTERGKVLNDPENFEPEARRRFQEYKNRGNETRPTTYAFDSNNAAAWVTKVAAENGYDMVVTNWGGPKSYRAQTVKELTPEADYTGFKEIPDDVFEIGDEVFVYKRYGKITDIEGDVLTIDTENAFGNFDRSKFQLTKFTRDRILLIEKAKPSVTTRSQKVDVTVIPGYERMMGEVEGIIEKTLKKGKSYNQVSAAAIGYIQQSAVYERADDSQREQIIRDFKKIRGEKMKTAPSVARIMGEIKDTKEVTVKEKTALKDQIKLEAKAAKDAVAYVKELRTQISTTLRGMSGRGVISAKQATAILARYDKMNILNPVMRDRFVDYMSNVLQTAEYKDKIAQASKLRRSISKAAKSEANQAEVAKIAKAFKEISPSMVDNIDQYIEFAESLLKSVSRKVGSPLMRDVANFEDMINYIDDQIQKQREQIKNDLLSQNQDLVDAGVLSSKMTINEIKKVLQAIENKEDQSEEKLKEAKKAVKEMMDEMSPIIKKIVRTGEDPFTGDPIDLTIDEKRDLIKLADMDTDDLSLANAIKAVEYANNFIANGITSGISGLVNNYEGSLNATELKDEGVKSAPIKKYFFKSPGRMWLQQVGTLPMLNRVMWVTSKRALEVMDKSGVSGVSTGKAKAISVVDKIVNEYTSKFSKIKDFLTAENIIERGMLAFMSRTVIGDEFQVQDEYNRRKTLIEETIEALKDPTYNTDAEIKKGKTIQKVYDKILKGSKNIADVKSKVSETNQKAVDWWVSEWIKKYDRLDEVSRNVYNTILSRDANYTPDRFQMKEASPAEIEDFESGFFGSFEYVNTSKSGSLRENNRIKNLPKDNNGVRKRIVNLDFDTNNVNAMTSAMVDVETASSIEKVKGFVTSKDFSKLFASPEDANLYKKRTIGYVNTVKGGGYVDQSEMAKLNKLSNAIASLGTAKALFSVSQIPKQFVPPMLNTLAQTGRFDIAELFRGGMNFINESGYPIATRGIGSQGELKSINRKLEEADINLAVKGLKGILDLNNNAVGLVLKYPDMWAARSSWISFYISNLKKQGVKTSNIDWSTHELNKKAADYAQLMVDSQQNISDTDMQGDLFTSKQPATVFLRRAFFPLMSFTLNQKTRIWADSRTLASKLASKEDKSESARSISGAIVEQVAFAAIRLEILKALWYTAKAIWGDEDEEDEEYEKKILMRQASSTAQNFMKDFFLPPLPLIDAKASEGVNYLLDQSGLSSSIPKNWYGIEDEDVTFNFYVPEKTSVLDQLGTQGIAAEKLGELYDNIRMSTTGRFSETYRDNEVEKQILDEDKDAAAITSAVLTATTIGVLPSEFASVANLINKKIKRRAEDVEED